MSLQQLGFVQFYKLVTRHRLAILPGATHYDVNVLPALADVAGAFLDEDLPD